MANIFKFRVTTKVQNTLGLGIGNYSANDTIYVNEKQLKTASFRNAIKNGYIEPAGEDDSKVSSVMMDYYNGSQGFGKNYLPVSTVELVQQIAAGSIVNVQGTDLCGGMSLGKRVAIDKIMAKFTTASSTAGMPRLLVVAGDSSPVTPTLLTAYDYTAGTYTAATNGSIAAAAPITWAANDMLLVAYTEKFASVVCDMTTPSNQATTATPYYWDGSTWVVFPAYHDYTVETTGRTLSRASALDKTRMVWWEKPDDWVAGGPSGSGAPITDYCVGIKFSGALTALAGGSVYPVLDTPIADVSLGTSEWIPQAVVLNLNGTYSDITASAANTLNSFGTSTSYIWLGFNQKVSSFYVDVTNTNTNASTAVVTYWNGTSFASCPTITDGSINATATFGKDGAISMAAIPEDWSKATAATVVESANNVPTTISTDQLFWLRFATSAAFDASVTANFAVNTGQPVVNKWYEFDTAENTFVDVNDTIKVIIAEPENNIANLTIQAVLTDI